MLRSDDLVDVCGGNMAIGEAVGARFRRKSREFQAGFRHVFADWDAGLEQKIGLEVDHWLP